MNGLINKPQFDKKVFKEGIPVLIVKAEPRNFGSSAFGYTNNGSKLIENSTYGLILFVEPLSITILLVTKEEVKIPVDAVANGEVKINFMEVKRDSSPTENVEEVEVTSFPKLNKKRKVERVNE